MRGVAHSTPEHRVFLQLRRWLLPLSPSLVLALTSAAHAGAWLQPQGHGQWALQTSYYSSSAYFDSTGERTAQPRFRKLELQPYIEYGLRENLTLGATGYLDYVRQQNRSNTGLADPEFFARTTLWKSDSEVLSIQPLIKLKSQFTHERTPRSGSRSNDLELSVLYGKKPNILSPNDYLDLRAGYRHRLNGLNDQWRADAVAGLEFAPGWYVLPAIRSITATKIRDTTGFSENADQDYDLTKLELGVSYQSSATDTLGITAFKHVMGLQTGNGMGVITSYTHGF